MVLGQQKQKRTFKGLLLEGTHVVYSSVFDLTESPKTLSLEVNKHSEQKQTQRQLGSLLGVLNCGRNWLGLEE